MFIVMQLPVADLRPFIKGKRGRLATPDWTSDDPGEVFVRSFGRISTRNCSSLGLVGERFFSDFNHAARFRGEIEHRQADWGEPLRIHPWFRRFYFDGYLAGRFEFGFTSGGQRGGPEFGRGAPLDPRALARTIADARVIVRGNDVPEVETTFGRVQVPLGMAYLASTTRKDALIEFPLSETHGPVVEVGSPVFHVRVSEELAFARGRDGQTIRWGAGSELFLTCVADQQRRRNVIVQPSPNAVEREGAEERAVRVLFSHLNSLIHALSKLATPDAGRLAGLDRGETSRAVERLIDRLSTFRPTGPTEEGDLAFAAAVAGFGRSYVGRVAEITAKLEALAAELSKPTTAEALRDWAKSLFELIVGKAVETGVGAALKSGP